MKTTIVIPCYNEATRLPSASLVSSAGQENLELLMVNDGSTDGTAGVLTELAQYDGLSFLDLAQNAGKAEAVRHGILKALEGETEAVGFWDADLATPLTAIHRFQLFLQADGRQLVMGARIRRLGAHIQRHWYRHYFGRIVATLVSVTLQLPTYDTQCGAKLFRRELAEQLFAEPFVSTWLFDVELLARAIHYHGRDAVKQMVYELPLEQWRDVDGSKVEVSFLLKILGELRAIHRRWLK